MEKSTNETTNGRGRAGGLMEQGKIAFFFYIILFVFVFSFLKINFAQPLPKKRNETISSSNKRNNKTQTNKQEKHLL